MPPAGGGCRGMCGCERGGGWGREWGPGQRLRGGGRGAGLEPRGGTPLSAGHGRSTDQGVRRPAGRVRDHQAHRARRLPALLNVSCRASLATPSITTSPLATRLPEGKWPRWRTAGRSSSATATRTARAKSVSATSTADLGPGFTKPEGGPSRIVPRFFRSCQSRTTKTSDCSINLTVLNRWPCPTACTAFPWLDQGDHGPS